LIIIKFNEKKLESHFIGFISNLFGH